MNKVVHLSSAHPPFDIRIFLKECRTLADEGYQVTFVVPHTKNEILEGVYIKGVRKATRRLERMTLTVWSVFRAALKEKGDVYHFHDPELIPIGILLKLLGKRVIYDVHEDLPRQILSKHWISFRLRKLISFLAEVGEKLSAALFDGVVAVTPDIACRFPQEKTVLVQNYPLKGELSSQNTQLEKGERNTVIYIGAISSIRGAQEMVEAVDLLPDYLGVRLVFAGSFSPAGLEQQLKNTRGWDKVDFLGWQSREQVGKLLVNSRAGIVPFHPVPNHVNSQPNKLFEYMSAGLPVIASDFPKWRTIISGHYCGLLINPLEPHDIASKIKFILENPKAAAAMGQNGRKAVEKYYSWDVEGKTLLALYDRLLGNSEEEKKE